jgi:hypothetical protein
MFELMVIGTGISSVKYFDARRRHSFDSLDGLCPLVRIDLI